MTLLKKALPVLVPLLLVCVPLAGLAGPVGKIFFTTERIKDRSERALKKQFARANPSVDVKRNKDKNWEITMVGIFPRKSYPGPITIWMYDKADKASIKAKQPVHVLSVDRPPTKTFVYDLLLDANMGFNKNRTYLIWAGQILGKRNKIYARGEINTKP